MAKRVELELSGLTCMGCVSAVKAALESVGARVEEINLERGVVEIDGEVVDYENVEDGFVVKCRL